jgi:thiol-disulfide isomerase/thioredoxin
MMTPFHIASRTLLAVGLLVLCACGRTGAPESAGIQAGSYRGVLVSPGGELPFGLELDHEGTGWTGYLINGAERLKLDEVVVDKAHLEIKMPGYLNRLAADLKDDQLQGEVVLNKLGENKDQHLPFHAQMGLPYRFYPPAGASTASVPSVAGRWAVNFAEEGAKPEFAVGEFTQSQDVVSGTFLTDTGDHRFLAGQVHDGELYLSTFDGAHAFLYRAKIGADGALTGDFWSGSGYHEGWTAKRDEHAALPDAYSLTAMRGGGKTFDFAFPDLGGHTVSSKDPQFQGKVMIVAIAGSWCPNCHDEAAFLAPLYKDYRGKGLEIVSLMFEHFGDFERAAAATERFRQHYGIEYTTLIAGISDKDEASKKLPMLDRVYGFPTTLFIDRKGQVRKIHTGFSGPATGEHYTQFVNEVKAELDQLLAET